MMRIRESLAAYEACIEGRKAFRDFTYGITRVDGVRCYVRISGEPVFDEGGNFRGFEYGERNSNPALLCLGR